MKLPQKFTHSGISFKSLRTIHLPFYCPTIYVITRQRPWIFYFNILFIALRC